ncbi:MAG: hypothetical protein R6U58_09015 [Bacteroidales bacterium]|jgi:hypothetical protein
MKTTELIKEIQKLPVRKRIYVIERTIRLLRKQEEANQMEIAAESLYEDYKDNKELTAFTNIDFENFYEAR